MTKQLAAAFPFQEVNLASAKHPSISVSGDLYRRITAACTSAGVLTAPTVAAIIDIELDRLEANPAKCAALVGDMVRFAKPTSTIATMPRKIYLQQAPWYRLYRARRRAESSMSNVDANSAMINAMLDKAGAP
jgi:hypothetical protein